MPPTDLLWIVGPGAHAIAAERLLRSLAGASPTASTQPVAPPTEAALRGGLAAHRPTVLVLAGEFGSVGGAYATLQLGDAAGAPRKLNVQALVGALSGAPAPALTLLLAGDLGAVRPGAAAAVDVAATQLVAKGVPCVVTLGAVAGIVPQALAAFVQRVAQGAPAGAAMAALAAACPTVPVRLHGDTTRAAVATRAETGDMAALAALAALAERAEQALAQLREAKAAPAPAEATAPESPAAQRLRQRRESGGFDVFLCHNSADKPAVKQLAGRLKQRGVLPWLDEWELPPGQPWQPLLERQIESIGSAAVCIGAAGFGRWHEQEMRGFLNEFVRREVPVIAVLLLPPGAPDPVLPLFLRNFTWVDFRRADPDPFEQLLWGITGQRGTPD